MIFPISRLFPSFPGNDKEPRYAQRWDAVYRLFPDSQPIGKQKNGIV
jgi:hypothetical protein